MDDHKKKNKLAGYSWFAFDVIDWLTSENVNRMTVAERGVYITLLAVQWRDGSLPDDCKLAARLSGLDVRIYKKWLSVWGFLFPRMQGCGKLANEKLWKLSVAVGKQAAAASLEERREEKRREEKKEESKEGLSRLRRRFIRPSSPNTAGGYASRTLRIGSSVRPQDLFPVRDSGVRRRPLLARVRR